MIRKIVALTAVALLAPGLAHALGLGPLETRSALNEPFNARIELVGATPADFDTLTVKLAEAEQFQRAGIPLTEALLNLEITIVQPASGPDYVSITTKDPVREPFLNFLLEINWENGRIISFASTRYCSTRRRTPRSASLLRRRLPVPRPRSEPRGRLRRPASPGRVTVRPRAVTRSGRSHRAVSRTLQCPCIR
jgi:pilus assembly protein FimV